MTYNQYYLAASTPQWGIFIGIVCVIIGYIDKKEKWMTLGWITLLVTGLISLYFNLTISPDALPDDRISSLKTAGWQCTTGAALATASYLFQRIKNRYFKILAILTLLYFMILFFQFYSLRFKQAEKPPVEKDNQNMPKSQVSNIYIESGNPGLTVTLENGHKIHAI